jgi:hypothetical protein
MRAWVRRALRSHNPEDSLANKAIELLTTGTLSRETVLADLTEALESARSAPRSATTRALRNVIDRLIGWTSLEASLERIGESENSGAAIADENTPG